MNVIKMPQKEGETEKTNMIALLLAALAEELANPESDFTKNIGSLAVVYAFKDGTVGFEVADSEDMAKVGMMCSAVHIACVYEMQGEKVH